MRPLKLLVVDQNQDLSLQVTRVAAGLPSAPAVVSCDGFDAVDAAVADAGPFDVLVVGPVVLRPEGFARLGELRALVPGAQLLLALDHWRSADLRQTVRAGAVDILRLPVDDAALGEAIGNAIEIGAALRLARSADDPSGPQKETPGVVIAVVSASGGSGKTFLATNLAYHLVSTAKKATCLVDLDLQFGEMSTALRIKPRHTIHDLLADDAYVGDTGTRFEEHLERHESGIRLLAAPVDPEQADAIEAYQIEAVLDTARAMFDYVVVDTPTALSEGVLVALEQADQIFVLATLDLPSVRNLGVMLNTLNKLKVPNERVSLLLNKVEADVGIDVARVEAYFPQGFSMVIPYGREVNRSLNMGQPVLAYAPRGEVSKVLASGLVDSVVSRSEDDEEEVVRPRRRRRRPWPARKSA